MSAHTQKSLTFLRSIIVIRLINAFWVTTFFQPDEYFQALEPAWDLAFGPNSGAWLTWEWHHQLRSSLHPVLFSGAYLIADYATRHLPLSTIIKTNIIVAAPRALQAVIAALGDWYTWQLAIKIYPDSNISSFALFLQLFSAWQWYASIRTFSNSLETTLTIAALYYFPWRQLLAPASSSKENPVPANSIQRNVWPLRASLCLAALAVILRPTNVLIWATIIFQSLTRLGLRGSPSFSANTLLVLLREAVLCGGLTLGISLISDRLYFTFWTFPPYNWLTFNITKSLAIFYGRNPWHYYLLQGLPLLCTTSLPFALIALYRPSASSDERYNILRTLSMAVGVTIGALSLISHKEVRFIYPLLPILNILAAPIAAKFFTAASSSSSLPPKIKNKPWLCLAVGVNVFLAGYLSFFHQPAPLSVLSYLRTQHTQIQPTAKGHEDDLFALFLMPCHSTPWRSHLVHPTLHAYALSCEPPLHTLPNTPERDNYRDEADRFYDDPIGFLSKELFDQEGGLSRPRYIVGFEGVEPWLEDFLMNTEEGRDLGMKLTKVWTGWNGLFNEDWRRAGKMVVWDTGVYGDTPLA